MSAPLSPRNQRRRAAQAAKNWVAALFAPSRKKPEPKAQAPAQSPVERANAAVVRRPNSAHRTRALICIENGVPNTGRQWRKLRKRLAREATP